MADYPRVSGSLRAFSGVGIQTYFPTEHELRQELLSKQRILSESRSLTWGDVKNIVNGKCQERDQKIVSKLNFILKSY